MGVTPEQAPNTPEYVTIDFEKGIPVAVNGKKMDGVAVIETLNALGRQARAWASSNMVENRLVGHEEPAACTKPPAEPSSTSRMKCSNSSAWTKTPST